MDQVRAYIIQVAASAMICAIAKMLVGEKNAGASMIKIICGILMCITVIKPVLNIRFDNLSIFWESYLSEAEETANTGQIAAREDMSGIIKDAAEAYILDKASAFELDITAEVTLSEADPPLPCAVCITGEWSPYAKSYLEDVITKELGISQEAQTWISPHT